MASSFVPKQFLDQYHPQVKVKLLLKDILCLKRRSCLRPVLSYGIARNKYYGVKIAKRMNLNCPFVEISKSTEPNYDEIELDAIAYTSSKLFQPERTAAEQA